MKIGITLGDPAGIGPEIILKAAPYIGRFKNLVIFGSKHLLHKTARDLRQLSKYKIIKNYIFDCVPNIRFQYGKPTKSTGHAALQSINTALLYGVDILVTPPIVKEVVRESKRNFIGHTEYLGQYFNTKRYAMLGLWRDKRIMLLTTHAPLRHIIGVVTTQNVYKKITLLAWGLNKYYGIKSPRIGVGALNPHGFEFSLGEDEKIEKAITKAGKENIKAQGPFPADTLFNRNFDGFLAMFHDQAMIYLKSKKDGLNFTMGLPIIRISPLYGAALDIAGTNVAETSGFIAAIKQGIKLCKNARKYDKKNA
jgi:4-hydroxythreonine-4-phosphate dehydrogenase